MIMNRKFTRKILSCKAGATAIEYSLIAAMIFLAAAGTMSAMGGTVKILFEENFTEISSALN